MFLLLFVVMNSEITFADRGGSNPTVTVVPTITHGTCFNPKGVVEYTVVVSSHWENEASMNSLQLNDDVPEVVYDHPDVSLSGTINDLDVGVYTFSGSVTVLNSNGMWVSVPFSATIWVGIETVWNVLEDMVSSPNSYSAKRNTTTQTYGVAYSKNVTSQSEFWMELKATYGSSTNSHLYWVVGETSSSTVFSPSGAFQYVEFYKTSSGNGIRLRQNNYGTYQTTIISTNSDDKVRVVRDQYGEIKIQLNDNVTSIYTFDMLSSDPMNIGVFGVNQDDGCLNAVSSFDCWGEVYAKMERKLRGVKYQPIGNSLKFYVTEEYDNQSGSLNYNVYSDGDRATPVLTGTTQPHDVAYGDNRYGLDVTSLSSGSYILEVINDKKEKFYLRFIK